MKLRLTPTTIPQGAPLDGHSSSDGPKDSNAVGMSPESLFAPIDPATITVAELQLRARTLLATYGSGLYPPDDERDLLTAISALLAQHQ